MEIPHEFFTKESILTFTGAVGATFIVPNALQKALNFNPRWLALFIAITICFFGAYQTHGSIFDYFLAFINGCLVYLSAAGGTQVFGHPPKKISGMQKLSKDPSLFKNLLAKAKDEQDYIKRNFLTKWF